MTSARYQRTLSEDEEATIKAAQAEGRSALIAVETVRRDRFFGFEGGRAEGELFSPREAELSETSAAVAVIAEPASEDDKDTG